MAKPARSDRSSVRMNMILTDRQRESLDSMANELGVTRTEIIKRSLAFMNAAIREQRDGSEVAFMRDGKITKRVVGIFD